MSTSMKKEYKVGETIMIDTDKMLQTPYFRGSGLTGLVILSASNEFTDEEMDLPLSNIYWLYGDTVLHHICQDTEKPLVEILQLSPRYIITKLYKDGMPIVASS